MTKTVDDQIRERLYVELRKRRDIINQQKLVEDILGETTQRIDDLVKQIVHEVARQQLATGQLADLREAHEQYDQYARQTATLAVNLPDVFFRLDVNLFAKHLRVAEDGVIVQALSRDAELLDRVREIIDRIDVLSEGLEHAA